MLLKLIYEEYYLVMGVTIKQELESIRCTLKGPTRRYIQKNFHSSNFFSHNSNSKQIKSSRHDEKMYNEHKLNE